MTAASLEAFVRALPKAELHLHLEGSITPTMARHLARRRGVMLPDSYRDGADAAAPRFADFRTFIQLYLALSSLLQQAEDVAYAVDDLAARLDAQGVRYAEVTFTPVTHLVRGVARDALVEGLVAGRSMGQRRGVEIRFVFDVVRSFPDHAPLTLSFCRAVARLDTDAVVGLGVGGPEGPQYPLRPLAAVFLSARDDGFRSLPHAGEQDGPASIRAALDLVGAERIGHGIRCIEDPRLVAELAERGIPLEVCPTSNVALGVCGSLAEHPLPRLIEAGVPVSLGSDDPPMFGTDLVAEYVRCAQAFGWGPSTIRALARASIEHAFMPAAMRARLAEAQDIIPDPPSAQTA